MRILIADDDPVARRLLERTLQRMGHEVLAVADGTAALNALLDPAGPRLAILDWMMPGLDGLAVCRAVREREAPYVYLILLTARDGNDDVVAGLIAEADDYLTKPFEVRELNARILSGERILELETRLLTAERDLRHEATHDRLTGLWNRGMVLDDLERTVKRVRRTGEQLTVALADVDHFKAVNDTYGHDAGDHVLRETARRMRASLRDGDAVGRYGGEEFLIVLASRDSAGQLAALDRVCQVVRQAPIDLGSARVSVTLSIGAARAMTPELDATSLISAADEALYRAKAQGRNCLKMSWRPAATSPEMHGTEALSTASVRTDH
ncbi:MAG TPA: diguanylate cyclase [Vicinamibacterales bacterium]|nr:diguanylate cyclase [Vicinamibacterales bacterium]